MYLHQTFDAFRSSDDGHKFDLLSTVLFNEVYSSDRRSAGCQHRICNNDQTLGNRARQLAVILVRFMGFLVTVQTDMTDLCCRHQCLDTADHTKTCTQDRHDRKVLSGDLRSHAFLDRSLYLYIMQRQIL